MVESNSIDRVRVTSQCSQMLTRDQIPKPDRLILAGGKHRFAFLYKDSGPYSISVPRNVLSNSNVPVCHTRTV